MVTFRAIGFDHWQSFMLTGESGIVTCYFSKNRRVHVRRHTSTLTVHGVFEAKENGLERVDHMGNLLVSSFFIFQLY